MNKVIFMIIAMSIVGHSYSQEQLEVEGAINIQDVSDINNVAEGTIRWTGTDFEGYDGTTWYSLTGKTSTSQSIGDIHQGGIVFQTYNNGQNGLIASLVDVDDGNGVRWLPDGVFASETTADLFYDGLANTEEIIDSLGAGDYAAMRCDTFSGGGYMDWYLPAKRELDALFSHDVMINNELALIAGAESLDLQPAQLFQETLYWSSTEFNGNVAFHFRLFNGNFFASSGSKTEKARVRCIRRF